MFELNTAKVAFMNKEYEKAAKMFHEGAGEGNAEALGKLFHHFGA